ncbi:phage integrase SAM-like domain-containing protein [Bacteroides cellulosilyticus]|uniref:phage integrase SAM-like domain-containing protein n=1 Tax=Bacteroides cellulosilyticus TaxID=246787 RepID=UPI002582FD35|nr:MULTISPECIES: phage integrase SAM-like domain-containing protein [Bacteroides]
MQFGSVTPDWLRNCEKFWLKTKNNTTIGMYFRNLRIIINEARKAGVIKEAQYPFGKGKYEIPVGQSVKKALSTEQLKVIFSYVCDNETTERYRDLCFFHLSV